ncbi:LysR family transcriptional regulator [Rhizobium halophytocola]|uniref:DNA-binding transcriptional LysR family regulator n=1 Tax=Rhizobium halophytocola TaxID=735519 RepID=A0ABS4E3Z5_9HYPH|nr:LysR family transcriptional regulator [Rhizobium halophytocola]MBP1852638.1 DNA-binding transcriptional LysR family regulator [Rhizobium halophytocola]
MVERLDWSHYRSLLAVLRSGSLSAAARDLGLTQPTLGRHIDALESTVGTPLFLRSQHGLLPTPAAIQMRPHAEAMEASAAALRRAASSAPDAVSGTVRISASEVIGIEVLPGIIASLQEEHPDLIIELSATDETEDLLLQRADIAVRMVAPQQEALVSRRVGSIPIGAYARRDYLERHGTPEALGDLERHRLIGFDRELAFVRAFIRRSPLLGQMHFAVRADSTLAQIAMIRAGGGIGFCQCPLADPDPALMRVLAGELSTGLETFVVMHEALRNAPRCRTVFDALFEGLRRHAGAGRAERPEPTASDVLSAG